MTFHSEDTQLNFKKFVYGIRHGNEDQRCKGKLIYGDHMCAIGAGLQGMGFSNDEIQQLEANGSNAYQRKIADMLGIGMMDIQEIWQMNDSTEKSWPEIADRVEKWVQ